MTDDTSAGDEIARLRKNERPAHNGLVRGLCEAIRRYWALVRTPTTEQDKADLQEW